MGLPNINYDKLKTALNKLAVSEIPSEKAYDKDSTYYTEDGKGHFPIRENTEDELKDCQDALRLLHHAPEDKQHEVKERVCNIFKNKYPNEYSKNC